MTLSATVTGQPFAFGFEIVEIIKADTGWSGTGGKLKATQTAFNLFWGEQQKHLIVM